MITTSNHPNSRIVTIFRKSTFAVDAQKETASDFIAMSKKSIGSYWENSHSKSVGSGLNFEEQKILMPALVDFEATDRNFRKACSEYFATLKTSVPYGKGVRLEVGLAHSNKEPVSDKNMPLSLSDYIAYRHALGHPMVSPSRKASEGDMLKEFYIFDPQTEDERRASENKEKDNALELYLKIRKQPEKIDMLLTILGVDPRKFTGKAAEEKKAEELKKLSESNPDKFVSTFEDKMFEQQYVVQSLINTGLLVRAGELIIEPATGETIGHNMLEAIAYIKDKANSGKLVIWKARMSEMLNVAPAAEKAR